MTELQTSEAHPKCDGCPLVTVEQKLKQLQLTVESVTQMLAELSALINQK